MRAQLKWISVDWKKVQKHICGEVKKSKKEKFQILEFFEKKIEFQDFEKKIEIRDFGKKNWNVIIFQFTQMTFP